MSCVVFPLFLLEIGYGEDFLGLLASVSAAVTGASSLVAPLLLRRVGFRNTVIGAVVSSCVVTVVQALWPARPCLIVGQVVSGCFGALVAVGHAPYLAAHGDGSTCGKLLSWSMAGTTAVATLSNALAGYLPGVFLHLTCESSPDSVASYRACLLVSAALVSLAVYPALRIEDLSLTYRIEPAAKHWKSVSLSRSLLHRVFLVSGVTGCGAGLIMPFMNAYWRKVHGASEAQVGTITALTGLAVSVGASLGYPVGRLLGEKLAIPLLLMLSLMPLSAFASLPPASASRGIHRSVFLFLLRTALANATTPLRTSLHIQQAPAESREWASSVEWLGWSAGWSLGAAWGGRTVVSSGYERLFGWCFATYAFAAMLYLILFW